MRRIITFLILQYQTADETEACVESIRLLKSSDYDKRIIIVDNCSTNGAFEQIEARYADDPSIEFLRTRENLGFSRGNNFGYSAVDRENTRFLVVTNNDVIFFQEDFIDRIAHCYDAYDFDIAGPDILIQNSVFPDMLRNSNPIHRSLTTASAIKKAKKTFSRTSLTIGAYGEHGLQVALMKTEQGKKLMRSIYEKRGWVLKPQEVQHGVTLQGACLILGPRFLERFDAVFDPPTFLGFEEDILALRAKAEGLTTVYDPSLQVLHNHHASFRADQKNVSKSVDNETKWSKEALGILEDYYQALARDGKV
ncbi:MAG: glycosyltransferase family 2 protein [Eggerthellaceae bacterium]|nr:glycosyltransferase family 2 protein [Eggerthellaceae bacterium]